MAWNHVRPWLAAGNPPLGTGLSVTVTDTGQPAAPGSTLVAFIASRPTNAADVVTLTVSDNLGGAWAQATDSNGNPILVGHGSSTRYAIFARLDAGGVTSITMTAAGTDSAGILAHVHEFSGGPTEGAVEWVAAGATRPTDEVWDVVEVDVPTGALVLGGMSVGVTNRSFDAEAPFTVIGDYKSSGRQNVAAYYVADSAQTIGPNWIKTSGGDTSINTITAAIAGTTGPLPLAVSVGQNQVIETGHSLPVAAQATGGSGTRTFAWTVQSGPAGGSFADPTAPNTTFTATAAGAYVLRCTVTDSTDDAFAELTVIVEDPEELPTVAFSAATGWAQVVGAATRTAALSDSDDASYVETSGDPDGELLTLTLPPIETPDGDFTVPLRLSATGGGAIAVVPTLHVDVETLTAPTIAVSGGIAEYTATWPAAQITTLDWSEGATVTLAATRTE